MLIKTKGKGIKQAFSDIAPILKKSEISKSIAIGLEHNKFFITADAGVRYQYEEGVTDVQDKVDMSVTVWFKDISSFFYAKDDITISIMPSYVSVEAPGFKTVLTASNAIINHFDRISGVEHTLDMPTLRSAVTKLSLCKTVTKLLQTDRPIIFCGDSAYIKFSTIWVKSVSSGLNSTLTLEHAKNIVDFNPKSVIISDVLEFRRDDATLVLPNTASLKEQEFDRLAGTTEHITNITVANLSSPLRDLFRATGQTSCKVYVFEKGLEIEVSTAQGTINKQYSVEGKMLTTFEIPSEYLTVSFDILGESKIEISRKEGLLCLSNTEQTILLSVL